MKFFFTFRPSFGLVRRASVPPRVRSPPASACLRALLRSHPQSRDPMPHPFLLSPRRRHPRPPLLSPRRRRTPLLSSPRAGPPASLPLRRHQCHPFSPPQTLDPNPIRCLPSRPLSRPLDPPPSTERSRRARAPHFAPDRVGRTNGGGDGGREAGSGAHALLRRLRPPRGVLQVRPRLERCKPWLRAHPPGVYPDKVIASSSSGGNGDQEVDKVPRSAIPGGSDGVVAGQHRKDAPLPELPQRLAHRHHEHHASRLPLYAATLFIFPSSHLQVCDPRQVFLRVRLSV